MPEFFIVYDDQTLEQSAENGVTIDDFQSIVSDPVEMSRSRSSGLPIAFGFAADGRYLACVFQMIDDDTIIPVTAYEIEV